MEPPGTLRALFVHNDWARDKLMQLTSKCTDEQLDRRFEMGQGTLRVTLHHLWEAEQAWLDRWLENANPVNTEFEAGISMSLLWEQFRRTTGDRNEFLDRIGDQGLSQRVSYALRTGQTRSAPIGDMVLHVCNHGIHHRAQALNMIKLVGIDPPGLDYIYMKLEPSPPPVPRFEVDTISEYYRYGDWAQAQVLAVAAGLSDEELDRTHEMGVGALRKTLLHICDAEKWWFENWSGESMKNYTALPPTTSIAELQDSCLRVAEQRNALLGKYVGDDLGRSVSARLTPERELQFPIGETMLQLCGHGTHHRAQALNMLRHLESDTPRIDYMVWFRSVSAG